MCRQQWYTITTIKKKDKVNSYRHISSSKREFDKLLPLWAHFVDRFEECQNNKNNSITFLMSGLKRFF